MALTAYRRHVKTCPHRDKGQAYSLCPCPVWCYGTVNGRRIRQSLGTSDGARALRKMAELERDGVAGDNLAPPLPEAVRAFLADCAARNLKASTVATYQRTLAAFCKFTSSRVDVIDTAALDAYRGTRDVKPTTWRKELETLRALFHFAISRQWISRNPAAALKMPRVEELLTQPLQPEAVQKLLKACDTITTDDPGLVQYVRRRARALVLTLLYSGLRVSDVARLERSALEGRHLTLRVLKNGVRLKVLLHDSAARALEVLPCSNPRYFFWTGNGEMHAAENNLRVTLNRLGKIAGVKVHPHQFRDTFAVELLTNGADIRTVQKLLGHSSVRTTERHYAHFVAAHQVLLDTATAKLDFERLSRPVLQKPVQPRLRNAK